MSCSSPTNLSHDQLMLAKPSPFIAFKCSVCWCRRGCEKRVPGQTIRTSPQTSLRRCPLQFGSKFSFGKSLSLAFPCVQTTVPTCKCCDVRVSERPRLTDWSRRLRRRAAWAKQAAFSRNTVARNCIASAHNTDFRELQHVAPHAERDPDQRKWRWGLGGAGAECCARRQNQKAATTYVKLRTLGMTIMDGNKTNQQAFG